MVLPRWLENSFLNIIDRIYALIPQRKPSLDKLKNVRIVAHRGVHDKTHLENTFAAFDKAVELGLWGIEFDIRWTQDLVPIVHHDEDCRRVFNQNIHLANINFASLRKTIPEIPTLEEVVKRYGKKIHLMIELKDELSQDPRRQNKILEAVFASLEPIKDYNLISLTPKIFDAITFLPSQVFYPIVAIRSKSYAKLCLEKNYGGLLGHYFFVEDKLINELQAQGKQVGFGFISSRNSLYRELNRGIDWVYTNNPKHFTQ